MALSTLRERDGQLVENWYVACLSRELKKDRPYQSVIYDQAYVLFRDAQGKAVCLPDQCLHRASQLSIGQVKNGTLSCPYHGWTYNGDGQVVNIPSEGEAGNCLHRHLCLKPLSTVEQDGMVWVWMGSREPATPTPSFRLPSLHAPGWIHFFITSELKSEVTYIIENFLDIAHTVFVHPGLFRNQTHRKVPMNVTAADGTLTIDYLRPDDEIGLANWIFNPFKKPITHRDVFLMPNLTRVDYCFGPKNKFIITSQSTPISTGRTSVYLTLFYSIPPLIRLLKPLFKSYAKTLLRQDSVVLIRQTENLTQAPTTRFHGTQADAVHVLIERMRELGQKDFASAKALSKSYQIEVTI